MDPRTIALPLTRKLQDASSLDDSKLVPDRKLKPPPWTCPKCHTTYSPYWFDGEWRSRTVFCERCIAIAHHDKMEADEVAAILHAHDLDGVQMEAMTLNNYLPQGNAEAKASQKLALDLAWECINDHWRAGHWKSLMLSGGVGLGKTHLMVAMARWVVMKSPRKAENKRRTIGFHDMPTWVQRVKNSYSNGGTERVLAEMTSPDVLFLDDIGAEAGSGEWLNDLYFQIVNLRYKDSLAIVASTNQTQDTLRARYPRAMDRLFAMTGDPIELKGVSYRQLHMADKTP